MAEPLVLPHTFYAVTRSLMRALFIGIGFIVTGIFLIYIGLEKTNPIDKWISISIGILSITFFGACTVAIIRKLTSDRVAYIFDSSGISFTARTPQVYWDDIADARIVTVQKQVFVGIFLKNPQHHLERCTPLAQRIAKANIGLTGTHIHLHPAAVGASNDDMLAWVKHYAKIS